MPNIKLTNEEFIARSRELFGDMFIYLKTFYTGHNKKVIVTCKIHGDIVSKACGHFKSKGCTVCNSIKKSHNKHVEILRKIHGDAYDYSNKRLIKDEPLTLSCKEHGVFTIGLRSHKVGKGCPACSPKTYEKERAIKEEISKEKRKQHFIDKCIKLYGDKYDFSDFVFNGTRDTIELVCKNHGKFETLATSMLAGDDCPTCRKQVLLDNNRVKFFTACSKIHNNKYLYDGVPYHGSSGTLLLNCPVHKGFSISNESHLKGVGCPECSSRGFRRDKQACLYLMVFEKDGAQFLGYGISNAPLKRKRTYIRELKRKNGFIISFEMFDCIGSKALDIERHIKGRFLRVRVEIKGLKTECLVASQYKDVKNSVLDLLAIP
jgi:hypothetical protein